jgi:hypothetical protein
VVQHLVHQGTKHCREHFFTDPPNRVLNDLDSVENCLVQEECLDKVIMVKIGITKVELGLSNNRVKILVFV